MTKYTFSENTVSDLYKDARGFRPNEYFWEEWSQAPDEIKQEIWDKLCIEVDDEIQQEKKSQATALLNLQTSICENRALGASSDKQALQWIMESEQFDEIDLEYGADYFCFHFGLAYSDKNVLPIQEAINEMLSTVV